MTNHFIEEIISFIKVLGLYKLNFIALKKTKLNINKYKNHQI